MMARKWVARGFLAGAVLFALLLGLAGWPLWLPLVESDAGRFEKVFGHPPPAGVRIHGSASAYAYDYEEIVLLFSLPSADLAAFLPEHFHPFAVTEQPAHVDQRDFPRSYEFLAASGLRNCREPLAFRASPWPGTGFHTISDAIVLHCAATGKTWAKGLGLD